MRGEAVTDSSFPLSHDRVLDAYRIMRTIREFEERVHVEFARGDIPGFVHLYAGEEAAARRDHACTCADEDRIASTHRGHGHCIAKGVDPRAMMKEIYGKLGGSCEGKGGSMHIADLDPGMMGANGILGGWRAARLRGRAGRQVRGNGEVAISFVGDGASNQGTFLESLNLAAVWKLPAIFVVENNGYAESTSREYAVAVDSYRRPRPGLRHPRGECRWHRLLCGVRGGRRIIDRARGGGARALECEMVRFFGHFEGDAQTYRGKGETDQPPRVRDCLKPLPLERSGRRCRAENELDGIDQEADRS